MLKKIDPSSLEVGMYVILPVSWLKHPFFKSSFLIKNRGDIDRILAYGFSEVTIDTAKGASFPNVDTISHGMEQPRGKEVAFQTSWTPETIIPEALKEAISDHRMPYEKKANAVYTASVEMMKRLIEDPKAENIREVKEEIADVVDWILSDDQTTRHMLKITTHDFYTYTHSVNVGILGVMLSKKFFVNHDDAHNMHELGAGFFLHDLGKVKVDPAIINKVGKLTDEEMKKMRIHPYQGYLMLKEAGQLSEESRTIILQHHERNDGNGYPRRLRGRDIHPYGRIGCIADVYDALTAVRSYKPKLSPFEALRVMKDEMINHFEKDLFEQFVLLFQ
jgi:HD-GYP domain-containing protein (c-di-GMP phosphodiesterase class II)